MKFSPQELQELSAEEIFYRLTDYADEHFLQNRYHNPHDVLAKLSQWEQVAYLVPLFEFEFNNGGLLQFLFSGSGLLADEIASAHRTVGAMQTSLLLENLLTALKDAGITPRSLKHRHKQATMENEEVEYADLVHEKHLLDLINQTEEKLAAFYPNEPGGDIWGLVEAYLDRNRHLMASGS